jgi:heme/copper-type cytochrome/quinol oxidase subunit 1
VVEVEEAMSHAAADVIFRTLFSIPIEDAVATRVFHEFRAYQRTQPILNLAAFLPLPRWFPRLHRRATKASAAIIRDLTNGEGADVVVEAVGHPATVAQMVAACRVRGTVLIGGIGGVMLAAVPFNIHVHDTYFVVSHLHFVLYGGSVFGIYAGLYHWFPKMSGRMLNERLGKIHFWLTYVGFFFTFFPQNMLGILGMPRRVAVYAPEFQTLNVIVSLAAFVLGISTFVLLINMFISIRNGRVAGANPWRALTLEWATTSPPPAHNFVGDPVPFKNPYGYGTQAAHAYLQAVEQRFGPSGVPDTDVTTLAPKAEPEQK